MQHLTYLAVMSLIYYLHWKNLKEQEMVDKQKKDKEDKQKKDKEDKE